MPRCTIKIGSLIHRMKHKCSASYYIFKDRCPWPISTGALKDFVKDVWKIAPFLVTALLWKKRLNTSSLKWWALNIVKHYLHKEYLHKALFGWISISYSTAQQKCLDFFTKFISDAFSELLAFKNRIIFFSSNSKGIWSLEIGSPILGLFRFLRHLNILR